MSSQGNHCSFVLLAEFHILEGAQLKYQFPQPLGVDEQCVLLRSLPELCSLGLLQGARHVHAPGRSGDAGR